MRRFLVALSFANLWYAPVWKRLIDSTPEVQFGMKALPYPVEYAAAIFGVMLCALVFMLARIALQKIPGPLRRFDVPIAFVLLVMSVRSFDESQSLRDFIRAHILFTGVPALLLLALLATYHQRIRAAATPVLLALLPFCAFTFAEGIYKAAKRPEFIDQPLASPTSATGPRVLWIIFDEWDQGLSFDHRPVGLALPAMDRLREESFYAENATSPADFTMVSIPSLIQGQIARSSLRVDAQTMILRYPDGSTQRFGDEPNLFSETRRAGLNAAVYGWYLPYCRVLGRYLTDCWWGEYDHPTMIAHSTFLSAWLNQLRGQFETGTSSPFGASLSMRKHTDTFETLLQRAENVAANQQIQLAFVHFDVPHPPFIYDRASGRMADSIVPPRYEDALALVDKAIGELRRSMEQNGSWNSVVLLLSSDHFYRGSPLIYSTGDRGIRDRRVPFLVHFPHQDSALTYARPYNTVVTSALIQAVLHSEVTGPQSLAKWLDALLDRKN